MPEGATVPRDPVVGQGRRARDRPCWSRSCCGRLPRPAPYQEGACSRPVPPPSTLPPPPLRGIACITDRAEIAREREIFPITSKFCSCCVRRIVGCDAVSICAGILGYLFIFLFVCGRNIFPFLVCVVICFFLWLARENR